MVSNLIAKCLADNQEQNILAVGGVGSECGGADVLGRVLGVAGVLSNENDLRYQPGDRGPIPIQVNSIFQFVLCAIQCFLRRTLSLAYPAY